LNGGIREHLSELGPDLIQGFEDLGPVQLRLLSGFLTIGLVVGIDLPTPVVLVVTSDDQLSVLGGELLPVQANGVEDHVTQQVLFYLMVSVVAQLNHQVRDHDLIEIKDYHEERFAS
jgi:hypothetical protein